MIVVETSRMTLFKASSIKKQNLSRERIKVKKFSTDIVLVFSTITAYMLLFGAPVNEAVAQTPYLNSKITPVVIGNYSTASVFCNDGDGMISGGYSIGFSSTQSAFDTMVYSNHPTQEINQTGYFEGWEAGLANKGNTTAEIVAYGSLLKLNPYSLTYIMVLLGQTDLL